MAATFPIQSPDGDTWHLDDREAPRVVRVESGQMYRIDPVVESQNGWYRITGYRIADLMESHRLTTAVVHTTREVLASVSGRFGFRTPHVCHFDGRVVEEASARSWHVAHDGEHDFGPLGEMFAAAWAPFAAMLAPALDAYPPQPSTPWDPRLAG